MSDKIDTVPQCGNKKQLREASEQKTAAPNCANSASFAMKISEIIHPKGDLGEVHSNMSRKIDLKKATSRHRVSR